MNDNLHWNEQQSHMWRLCLILTGAHGHTPSRDCTHGASGGTAGGQSHRLNILVDGSLSLISILSSLTSQDL